MESLIVGGVGIALLIWTISIYNGFVALRASRDASWSDIDVQLTRRYNLIPNLVEVVKAYARHEQDTLEQVIRARQQGMDASTVTDQGAAENMLSTSLQRLFVLAESYPDLKANGNFMDLQHQLSETEDLIQNARRYYNAVVRDYNTKVDSFPDLLIARLLHFAVADYFEMDDIIQRSAPQVSLS
ncbi:MAG: hypothetical protein CO186_00410 [Zetaproteobacteria bacterium CG_4_9_14_3_um_filter_49_83]|nr:MAG: hypothetical protein AUJ56_13225 [Zetaproteobacteria bacterium CG1_02_49_23]PIQ32012.1 MAG: hypothetical protein COW62_08385 [Zetaproteobacteria bacterium CG17_big_fil_post_rev_8_21_14_2_50_50_13]PIV31280.1 MAG: hypothetical protein COS35_02220 [Zetaproteobacteria bacterium CG02_land_8_20_14_3_00_50_9]PIY56721.1 MAG: hypothetical protein COZ00_02725 [Zetaproteobacteria bacterium CG_4_10_14_0_8_um_filter_49_80]PJA36491.1 MAG: hypothetical protein CO186_00410 [Zetaproteobacteria bacterium